MDSSNRIVIKSSSDTYYDDEEPTIPSMRPQAIADREKSSLTQLQILALAGLISATLVVVGGVFNSTIVIGLSGVLMVIGNIQAAVRR